jgi:hypothetical protein
MIRFTFANALTLAALLLCGSPSRIKAQGDTKVVVGDGGSIRFQGDGLDAGSTWTWSKAEVQHKNSPGVLRRLQITDAGADRCGGNPTCGIDVSKAWNIQVSYGRGSVTIASISSNKGLHLTHRNLPFDQWKPTGNANERVFGHGDSLHITGINVNNGNNLCSGNGGCEITLFYSPQ